MSKMGQKMFILFLIVTAFSLVMSCDMEQSNKARYDNYRLVRLKLETQEHVELFQELEELSDSYTFYGHALNPGQELTIMVAAHK